MAKKLSMFFVILSLAILGSATASQAKPKKDASTQPVDPEAYTKAIEKRAATIVATLHIDDAAKADRVQQMIIAQYRALNDWQANDKATNHDAANQSSLKSLHDQFLKNLSAELTPEQIEAVKDGMTVNKVRATYDAYCMIVKNLTEAEKAKMLELLKEAREKAIDAGSMEEKSAIFKKYKGKINIYLDSQGHEVSKDYKTWGQAQKAKMNGATTEPVAQ